MKWAFIYLILLFPCIFFGQNGTDKPNRSVVINEAYIDDYSNLLSVKFFGVLKSNQIGHFDNWTQQYVYYRPNENFNIGFGFVYKWLGFDLAFSLPFINDDDAVFGKTKRFDLQFNTYLRRFVIDFNFQAYKGYYGSNPGAYVDGFNLQNPEYPIRPDISSFNTAVNALYIFKPEKFSYRAAFVYNERQLKSAGSFLAGTYLSYFKMTADSTIVPHQLRDEFNPDADFRNNTYINTGISGGYGHTFVIKNKVYFSLSVAVGFGPVFRKIPEINNIPPNTDTRVAARAVFRTALGYNAKNFYAGISAVSSQSSEVDKELPRLERNINNFKIFIGKRFAPPAFLKKI